MYIITYLFGSPLSFKQEMRQKRLGFSHHLFSKLTHINLLKSLKRVCLVLKSRDICDTYKL